MYLVHDDARILIGCLPFMELGNAMPRLAYVLLFLPFAFPLHAFGAPQVERAAEQAFQRCLKETKAARVACSSGGCGNILASCYEQQIGVIVADTDLQAGKLKNRSCSAQAETLLSNFDTWQAANAGLQAFDGTWSGFELKVQSELLKNRAVRLLARECGA